MNRDRKISIAIAVGFHLLVLFAISPAVQPAIDEKQYVQVELAAGLPVENEGLGQPVKTITQAEAASTQPLSSPKTTSTITKPQPAAVRQPAVVQTKDPEQPALPKPSPKITASATPDPEKEKASTKQAKKEISATTQSLADQGSDTATPGIGNDAAKRGKPGGKGSDYYDFGQAGWNRRITPEYPSLALRRREEGTVVLTLFINERGKLDKAEVKESSGHSLLDEAAVMAAKYSTFFPATTDGKPVKCKVEVPYTFKLSNEVGDR